jgi:hypothetical protein
MSAITTVYLNCDAEGDCFRSSDSAEHTAAATRQAARASGWHVSLPGGRDVCPDCWAEGKR